MPTKQWTFGMLVGLYIKLGINMIGLWQPAKTNPIDTTLLEELSALGALAFTQNIDLNAALSSHAQQQAQAWLKLNEEDWQASLENLDLGALFPLAVFFTLAEMQLSGYQCGARNPAIWCFRWLRKHQAQPAKEQIQQLKKLTDNRFIPYGSVL
jgi:hypothetical protein